jgi:CheY-like chemotaxis protein
MRFTKSVTASRPLIVLADRVAPMRRALRRLLGERRFKWEEVDGERGVIARIEPHDLDLLVIEAEGTEAVPWLRAHGCQAPVVLLTNGNELKAAWNNVVMVDRLQAAARLPALVERLLTRPAA